MKINYFNGRETFFREFDLRFPSPPPPPLPPSFNFLKIYEVKRKLLFRQVFLEFVYRPS